MRFKYQGITRNQKNVSGVVDAADEVEAKLKLRSMQIRPMSIAKASEKKGLFAGGKKNKPADDGEKKGLAAINFNIGKPIDLKGLIVFTRQFSSLIDSGVPVVQCLDILFQQEKRVPFRRVLKAIKMDIEAGSGLAQSLARHPKVFSEFFIRIVEAGEVSGTLDQALRRVGIQLERLGKLKAKVIGAMMYPCITLVVAIVVLLFLLIKVVPEIAKMYGDNNAKLPELTTTVLGISAWVQENYLTLIVVVGVMVVSFPLAYRTATFRKFWDPFILKVPGFGGLIKKSAVARFSRTMATLVASGVPLLGAFDICLRLMSNLAIREVIQQAMTAVTEGKSIAQGLAVRDLFPPMVIHMVNIGEMTGKLDELLSKVADIYDEEVDGAVSALTGLIQPIMIVCVGGIIAFLLLAMYLPIFQLAEKTQS